MLVIILLAVLAAFFGHLLRNSPPADRLYRCVEDGDHSALYERRYRQVQLWGNCGPVRCPLELGIVEYRRITCASGKAYTGATSGWYTPTGADDRTTDTVDHYSELLREDGNRLWREQIVITRKVARGLRKLENPRQGFAAT